MSEKTSSYCFPIFSEWRDYTEKIENIGNQKVRIILKLILVSGFRIGEIMNSYLFEDSEGNIIIRSLNSKSKKVKIMKGDKHYSEFLGRKQLEYYRTTNQNVFKSVKIDNIFNLDLGELEFLVNENPSQIEIYVGEYLGIDSYISAYRLLRKEKVNIKVKYKRNTSETDYVRHFTPSFHFYRKLFASHYNKTHNYNFIKTIDFMKWRNTDIILDYVKDY